MLVLVLLMLVLVMLVLLSRGVFLLLDVVGKVEMVWLSMTVHKWNAIGHSAFT